MNKLALPLTLITLFLASCGSKPDAELKQASAALRKMASNSSLINSCFTVVYPQGQPTDYVNYIFSDMGAAEWPVAFDEFEQEQMASIGQPTIPPTVTISPNQRRNPNQKELVLIPDNEARIIKAHGYMPNINETNFEDELPLGTTQAKEGVSLFCEETIDMGIGVE